mgnify:CR=1 FL=1
MKRVCTASIATLGCKLNQSESDQMARQLAAAGVAILPFGQPVDLCIVNSCTVTHVGDRKSRQLIRQAHRRSPDAFLAVAGCYAEMDPSAVAAIEGVDAVLGNRGKERLVEELERRGLKVGAERVLPRTAAHRHGGGRLAAACEDAPAPTLSRREGGSARARAFVKIQDGCDSRCSYCIVPQARGRQRSRPKGEVIQEIRERVAEGFQEVVLTGVNITAYGRDLASAGGGGSARGRGLMMLLRGILAETEVPRIRLSSLQPEDWSPAFYDLWASGRMCRHLHLSLQSGSDAVLKRMHRRYNVDGYARVVAEARQAVPGVAITTDVIVGFPGETELEHRETEGFLRSVGFAGLHVFKYSPRAGTPAARMPDQVDPRVKQERSERLMRIADEMEREFRSRFLGTVLDVLWEEMLDDGDVRRLELPRRDVSHWWSGLSDNYVRVYAPGEGDLVGLVSGVRADGICETGLVGSRILDQEGKEWTACASSARSRRARSRPTSSTRTIGSPPFETSIPRLPFTS